MRSFSSLRQGSYPSQARTVDTEKPHGWECYIRFQVLHPCGHWALAMQTHSMLILPRHNSGSDQSFTIVSLSLTAYAVPFHKTSRDSLTGSATSSQHAMLLCLSRFYMQLLHAPSSY